MRLRRIWVGARGRRVRTRRRAPTQIVAFLAALSVVAATLAFVPTLAAVVGVGAEIDAAFLAQPFPGIAFEGDASSDVATRPFRADVVALAAIGAVIVQVGARVAALRVAAAHRTAAPLGVAARPLAADVSALPAVVVVDGRLDAFLSAEVPPERLARVVALERDAAFL
jgi:hypothetical protein